MGEGRLRPTVNDQGSEAGAKRSSWNLHLLPKGAFTSLPQFSSDSGESKRLPGPARAGFLKTARLFSKAKLLYRS